jgi:hypothetical protein
MHPLIRIVCFLIFAAWLAWGGSRLLLFGTSVLVALYLLVAPAAIRDAGAMIRRLRWLLVSLLIVYGWFTPGRPVDFGAAVAASPLLPTVEGIAEGLLRCAVLVVLVLAVNLLLYTTGRDRLLGAVYDLARPLAPLGLSRERLALRMILAIEAIGEVRHIVADGLAARRKDMRGARATGEFAAGVIGRVIAEAERRPSAPVAIRLDAPPAPLQWGFPALLWGAFYAAGML